MANIYPELVSAAVQIAISRQLLRSARDARRALVPFANRNLARAEQQFEKQMEFRDFDKQVYDYVRKLPRYKACLNEVHRGSRTGAMAGANILKSKIFSYSRYNSGAREQAVNSALSAGIVSAGEIASSAGNFEDTLEIAYDQLRWTAMSNSARFTTSGGSRAFSDVASSLIRQAESTGSAAEKSIASLAYLATTAILKVSQDDEEESNGKPPRSDQSTALGSDFNKVIRAENL